MGLGHCGWLSAPNAGCWPPAETSGLGDLYPQNWHLMPSKYCADNYPAAAVVRRNVVAYPLDRVPEEMMIPADDYDDDDDGACCS